MTDRKERQGTSGWIVFASVMIVVGSLSHLSMGMTFVFNTTWALANTDYTSESTVQLLGFIQLGIGVLMLISAWGVLSSKIWARAVGVIFGVLTVVHGITNIQVNGILGVFGILVGLGVIFALTVKGSITPEEQALMGEEGAPIPGVSAPLEGELPSEQYAEEDRREGDV